MNSNLKFDFTVNKENNTIVVEREFAGNLETVWKAWTTAEILDQWWAPEPCRAETRIMDFREGGYWLYCMMMPPDDQKNWGRQNYEKIVLHEKFSGTDVFCDKDGIALLDSPAGRFENLFSEANGKTLVTVISTHNSLEEIQAVIDMGFKEGLAGSFENLDKYLSQKQ